MLLNQRTVSRKEAKQGKSLEEAIDEITRWIEKRQAMVVTSSIVENTSIEMF